MMYHTIQSHTFSHETRDFFDSRPMTFRAIVVRFFLARDVECVYTSEIVSEMMKNDVLYFRFSRVLSFSFFSLSKIDGVRGGCTPFFF